jgi:RNA-directed DNA polymerase
MCFVLHLLSHGASWRTVDFLGFHHRWVRATRARHVEPLARWPSRRAMQHARDRVREITARERLLFPVEEIVQDLNRYLRG